MDGLWTVSSGNSFSFCKHTDQEVMTCDCGEEETEFSWVWSKSEQAGSIVLGPEQRQVSFSPHYSSGTAAVRGHEELLPGQHHYWEIKMTSAVYGTDIMVGVGTEKCDLRTGIHSFCSLLGRDKESWGFSYNGNIQHEGKFSKYGIRWGKGSLVGIHLDSIHGTLEFFVNRKPLGVAFTGLQNKKLYPVIASTSARSGMKLVSSHSVLSGLQFLCLRVIFQQLSGHPKDLPFPPGLQTFVKNNYWSFFRLRGIFETEDKGIGAGINRKRCHMDDRSCNLLSSFKRRRGFGYTLVRSGSTDSAIVPLTSRMHFSRLYDLRNMCLQALSSQPDSSSPESESSESETDQLHLPNRSEDRVSKRNFLSKMLLTEQDLSSNQKSTKKLSSQHSLYLRESSSLLEKPSSSKILLLAKNCSQDLDMEKLPIEECQTEKPSCNKDLQSLYTQELQHSIPKPFSETRIKTKRRHIITLPKMKPILKLHMESTPASSDIKISLKSNQDLLSEEPSSSESS